MDRVKIKEEAKAKIKGNLWTIWKPILIVAIISSIVGGITKDNQMLTLIVGLLFIPVEIGVSCYILKFIRNQDPKLNDLWSQYYRFVPILVTSILISLTIMVGLLALVIPGIVIAFGLIMSQFIMADPEYSNLEYVPVLKESWRLTKGYKMDYFVFQLSFIGWLLLITITLGVAAIYVLPYMATANALYYEKLKTAPRQ